MHKTINMTTNVKERRKIPRGATHHFRNMRSYKCRKKNPVQTSKSSERGNVLAEPQKNHPQRWQNHLHRVQRTSTALGFHISSQVPPNSSCLSQYCLPPSSPDPIPPGLVPSHAHLCSTPSVHNGGWGG